MEPSVFLRRLRELLKGRVVVTCHHNADPDAAASAVAMLTLLRRLNPSVEAVFTAPGLSKVSARMLEHFGITAPQEAQVEKASLVIVVDACTLQQLDELGSRIRSAGVPVVFVDHHTPHPDTERLSVLSLVDESSSSTAEIVYRLLREAGVSLSREVATLLMAGIAYDTGHYALAGADTFRVLAELVDSGADPRLVSELLTQPMDRSERIARLKACQRMRFHDVGGWLVALSEVSSHQASVARALLSLGAHVAVVAGFKEGVLRISMRACREFYEKTGVHLGRDVAIPLGEMVKGAGGGHPTSAGVNGSVEDVEWALERALELLRKLIGGG